MEGWLPSPKDLSLLLFLGSVYCATLGLFGLYKRRQLLHTTVPTESVSQQQRLQLRENIVRLGLSLLLLMVCCGVELFSSAGVVSIVGTLFASLLGTSLLSGLLILREKSKWRYQQ